MVTSIFTILNLFIYIALQISGNKGLSFESLYYAAMITPRNLYRALISIVVISGIMSIYRFKSSNEWLVIESFGIRTWRILRNILLVEFMFVIIMTYIGETIAIDAELQAKRIRTHSVSHGVVNFSINNLWFKEKDHFIHVNKVLSPKELQGIDFFEVQNNNLVGYRKAESAFFITKGEWELHHIQDMDLTQHNPIKKSNKEIWHSGLHPSVLVAAVAAPTRMSLSKLFKALVHSKGFGILNDDTFNIFISRVMMPLLALCSLVITCVILLWNSNRNNINRKIVFAMLVGLCLIFIQQPALISDQWLSLSVNSMILFAGVVSFVTLYRHE
tara:strand:+ start:2763 stop:3752 length:990 start_codon:yes stop_codon:yes gene_type:complete